MFYHLAWIGAGGKDKDDYLVQQSNIGYMADALRLAEACGCKMFVGAGSQTEYGVVDGICRENEVIPHPFQLYGATKLAAYHMGEILAKQLGIRFVWPRIYSVYGEGENSGTLISYLVDSLLAGKEPQLSECNNTWNFLEVSDCARILAKLGDSESACGVFNVASLDTRILREFVEEVRDIVSPQAELQYGVKSSEPHKTYQLNPDIGRLIGEIGDDFAFTPFTQGIRQKIRENSWKCNAISTEEFNRSN